MYLVSFAIIYFLIAPTFVNANIIEKKSFDAIMVSNINIYGISSNNLTFFIFTPTFVFSNNSETIHIEISYTFFGLIIFVVFAFVVVSIYLFLRRKEHENKIVAKLVSEKTEEILQDKDKTDRLLAKLLPQEKVEELKNSGKATSQKFEMVTVLFSDIQGFTKIAEEMNPEKLIDELDNFFLHFDMVVEKHNIEKIKTIGDAYMCAGGIPDRNRTNPVEVVMAALEVQDYMRQLREKNSKIWDLRIGIHTGAVIAGVVGNKRMSYDIWGDTVNTASRMESSSEVGRVNISEHTYNLVKEFYICEHRGRMPVKYKGEINMFFVKGIRPEYCEGNLVTPNSKFLIKLQLLRIYDLEYHILNLLRNELPDGMYFHNAAFTEEIFIQAELIGRAENLSQEELLYVRTAALFLNIGYIKRYDNILSECIAFSKILLAKFKYSETQIEIIQELILSYFEDKKNPDKLLSVLMDASHAHYGRTDFIQQSLNHFNEMKIRKQNVSLKEWFSLEMKELQQTPFYNKSAELLREISIDDQIKKIKEFLKNH